MSKAKEYKNGTYYQHAIPETINDIAERDNLDLVSVSDRQFFAVLIEAGKILFSKYDLKIQDPNKADYNKPYDINLLHDIADTYIYVCCRYNKKVSVFGFSLLTQIPFSTFDKWKHDHRQTATPAYVELIKKLSAAGQEILFAMTTEKGVNPVGVLGEGNNRYMWSTARVQAETSSQRLSIDEIRQKIGLLSDNSSDQ